jgi:CHAT domain-containing protein
MTKVKQQAYLELVNELLNCPEGQEQALLESKPEMVDKNLVKTLMSVAQNLRQGDGQASKSTVEWLEGIALDISEYLGLKLETDDEEEQLRFLLEVLQLIADGERQVVYSLLRKNLRLLHVELLEVLKSWVNNRYKEVDHDAQKSIAGVVGEFGNLIQDFPLGNKAENMELSISSYELALKIFNIKEDPEAWGAVQNSLAVAHNHRIRGDRAENLENAIAGYQSALQVCAREYSPIQWAMTQNNLAIAYLNRIKGDRAENLESSIRCCKSALQVLTQEHLPIDWAMTQNNFANAYLNRIRGDRAENLENAIAGYGSALKIYTKENFPIQWATTQNNLANAYLNRIRGDRAENLELSIQCYQSALQVRTQYDLPIQWASTQNNLATAYSDRIKGDRAENLELSIQCYQSALEIYTWDDLPIDWATTQNNLANTYLNRIRGDKAENLEYAIYGYKSALMVRTRENFPIDWAMTQYNLATACLNRIRGDKAKNLEYAIACYESALEIYTKGDFPIQWAETQENIAILYAEEGKYSQAIDAYEKCTEIFQPQILPISALKAHRGLASIYFKRGQWQKAIDAYEIAMQAVETSRSWSVDDSERQRVLGEGLSVYENAIQCAVQLRNYPKAIEYTERIRSRQLVELMASKDLYSDAQVPIEIQKYLAEYQQLNQQIKNLHEKEEGITSVAGIVAIKQSEEVESSKIHQLEAHKQDLYKRIRSWDPVLAGQIAIAPISYSEIQQLIPNIQTAILIFYSTDDNTYIFTIRQNQEPELLTCEDQGWHGLQLWLIEKWLVPYNRENNSGWRTQMPELLAEIAKRLQAQKLVTNNLQGIQEIILIPHLLLHQIPFAALPIHEFGELLGSKFTIRSAPSCQILQYCQQRPPVKGHIQGIVEDTDGSLMGTRYEGQKIAEIHLVKDGDRLSGRDQGTVANYRKLLSRVNHIHSSHHATSRLDNPLESALIFSDGKITLRDLLLGERYPNLDEVFLSACETNIGKYTFTDDLVTLSTGFLCIGARSVQSTLWSIDDLVTAIFDIFYHQERREGYNRAVSLKRAQIRLQHLSGEEFRTNHYPELKQFTEDYLPAELETIEEQIEQLGIAKETAKGDDRSTILRKLSQLEKLFSHLEREHIPILKFYSEQSRPFASPYYWAGFICQGMA